MLTPHKLSLRAFTKARLLWIEGNCVADGEHQRCRTRNTLVEVLPVYFSIHDAWLPECAGGGKVMRLVVPFCPKCEAQPEEYSCLHETSMIKNPEKSIWNTDRQLKKPCD